METSILIQFVLAVLVIGAWRYFETIAVTLTREGTRTDPEALPGDGRAEVE